MLVIHFLVHPETIFCKTLTSSGLSAKGNDREQKIGCGVASHDECPFSLRSTEDLAITPWGLRAPGHTLLGVLVLEEWASLAGQFAYLATLIPFI